ncbi:MAG: BatA domain-containing protein [Gammaproteobacteria bacterium]|nr:BatA domain-containing protein [Gammaproteobacteria bacterium]MDP2140810.1 BatA domain-containing protein [Gammaproteobacteria bacterium]MDP2347556.1 BatA domain-containing protein [Gammaproteobacteria bacterium]
MAFLTPLFLFGLLAAAIPVAIHLIRREKPPKMLFSTLRFLKNTSKKLIFFQQIQQWLLLLLRAAVICLIVFAFARPLFDSTIANFVDGEPESAVILIDVSMSMLYGDRFEQARAAARDIVAGMGAGDEVAVIAFANGTVSVRELSSDLEGAAIFINNLAGPGFEVTRYMPGLRLANDMLESSRHDQRSVYLVSDYQANGLGNDDSGWMLSPGVNFNSVDVGQGASRNLLLTDVRSPDQLIENRDEYEILARVRSSGSVHVEQAEVRLTLNGQEQIRVPVNLRDTSEEVVRLPVVFDAEGTHRGEISVSGDDFAIDNIFYFTVDVMPRISVLVVNGEPSLNWYEDEAHWFSLAVGGGVESPFVVVTTSPRDLDTATLAEHDVVVLLNVGSDFSTSQASALVDYVQEGGSLLMAPGDRVNAAQFNEQFGAISPAELGQSIRLGGGDYLLIADMDRRHPVLLPLGSDWGVRFDGYWAVSAQEEADVLMQFDNSSPALLERSAGQGRVMLFASSLDTEWNNLPLQGLYLPFIHESLRYLAQASGKDRAYRIGDVIDLSSAAAEDATLTVTSPSGDVVTMNAGNRTLRAIAVGFISVAGDGDDQFYAVNADPAESALEKIAPSALHDRVVNPETTPMQSMQVRRAELIAEREGPQRVWWWILLLVVMVLLAETRIANTTYR